MTINTAMNRGFSDDDLIIPPGDFASAGIPVVLVTTQEEDEEESDEEDLAGILPLPASRYRYTKWHEVEHMEVSSHMLRSPRIRKGPRSYKKNTIFLIEEQDKQDTDVDVEGGEGRSSRRETKRKRKKRLDYMSKLEVWESCECVNLSYQDLGHPYQFKEFYRVLRRLIRCEQIQLVENSLSDLKNVLFQRCTHLYLQRNLLSSLKKLPKIPNIQHLSLQQNDIQSLEGLETLKNTRLKSLVLEGNPVSLDPGYRKRVFTILPNLKLLDGLPNLPSDLVQDEDEDTKAGTCCIC